MLNSLNRTINLIADLVQSFHEDFIDSGRHDRILNRVFELTGTSGVIKAQAIAAQNMDGSYGFHYWGEALQSTELKHQMRIEMEQILSGSDVPKIVDGTLPRGKIFSMWVSQEFHWLKYVVLQDSQVWTHELCDFIEQILKILGVYLSQTMTYLSLSENESTLERILNSIDALIYVSVPDTGEMLFINDKMEKVFGISNVVGKICWQVLQEGFTGICDFCPTHRLKSVNDPPVVWEEHNTVTRRSYQNTDRLIRWVDGRVVHIQHSVDITDLKQAEERLYEVNDQLSAYTGILNTLHGTMDVREAFEIARVRLIELYKCDNLDIVLNTGNEAICRLITSPNCLYSYTSDSPESARILIPGMKQAYVLGLFNKSRLLGYTLIQYKTERTFDDRERELLLNTAKLIENLMLRKNLEDERAGFAEQLERNVEERTRELHIMTKAAESAQAAAESAARSKSMFLANMSHEIRTPMNAIIGMTDLLFAEKLEDRQMKYVRDIQSAATSLLGIINDILDMSKIDAGKLSIVPVHFDLSLLLKDVMSMMGFSAMQKGLRFDTYIKLNDMEYIIGDDIRIKQILINILSNAIKFTKQGHVKLSVWIDGGEIYFEVSDTGIGIHKDELPFLFTAFEQADMYKNRAIKGTGLGLSISKSLVEMMEGSIVAESVYGTGTTFRVRLPYTPGEADKVALADEAFNYIKAPTAYVLVVDDIQTNLTVAEGLLRLCEIKSDLALSGYEALELLDKNEYDMVFMDHMMPELDGVETTELIRKRGGALKTLPIIALTANAINESRDYLLSAGLNDFLAKPIEKNQLMTVLQKWLPQEKIEAVTEAADQPRAEYSQKLKDAAQICGLDIELALSRIGYMQDVLEDSIKLAASTCVKQAGKLSALLQEKNLPGFAILVHGIRGSMANIGATELSEQAGLLETAAKSGDLGLCEAELPRLNKELLEFSERLIPIFASGPATSLPGGDAVFLAEKVSDAIHFLEDFEIDAAEECLGLLEKYTFGPAVDEKLAAVREKLDNFDYESGAEVLRTV